jgi:hypothetical protein
MLGAWRFFVRDRALPCVFLPRIACCHSRLNKTFTGFPVWNDTG